VVLLRAAIAIAHSVVRIIYYMLRDGTPYPGETTSTSWTKHGSNSIT